MLDPGDYTRQIKSIDILSNFDDINNKVNKLWTLLKTGTMDKNVAKYLPDMLSLAWQSTIYSIKTKKACRLTM